MEVTTHAESFFADALFDQNPMPMAIWDADTMQFFAVNDAALAAYGYSRNEFLTLTILTIRPVEDRGRFLAWHAARENGANTPIRVAGTWRHIHGDGRILDVELAQSNGFTYRDRSAYLVVIVDITDRRARDETLRATGALLEAADAEVGTGTFSLELQTGRYQHSALLAAFLSPSGRLLRTDSPKLTMQSLLLPRYALPMNDFVESLLARRPFEREYECTIDGRLRSFRWQTQIVTDSDQLVSHIIGIVTERTEARAQAERLETLALCDVQTGLPNRTAVFAEADAASDVASVILVHAQWLASVAQHSEALRSGWAQEVARLLVSLAPRETSVSRFSENVFAIVEPRGNRGRSLAPLAKKILAAFEVPLRVGGADVVVIPSIGVAYAEGDRVHASDLVRAAECALDVARRSDSNVAIYDDRMRGLADRRVHLETQLRGAIADKQLSAVYAPIVSLSTGRPVGAEAFMRWECPGIGAVLPTEFLAIAEESDLTLTLGEWMLREACAQARRWQLAGLHLRIAVNVSAKQVQDRDFLGLVSSICEKTRLEHGLLELDLTATTMLRQDGLAVRNLQALRRRGTRVAIDDFGADYRSLTSLKKMPIDTVKIDRSFVAAIATGSFEAEVTRAVISLAHRLDLRVIGEGVENELQQGVLGAMGCDEGQGHLFGQAVGADAFLASARTADTISTKRASRL